MRCIGNRAVSWPQKESRWTLHSISNTGSLSATRNSCAKEISTVRVQLCDTHDFSSETAKIDRHSKWRNFFPANPNEIVLQTTWNHELGGRPRLIWAASEAFFPLAVAKPNFTPNLKKKAISFRLISRTTPLISGPASLGVSKQLRRGDFQLSSYMVRNASWIKYLLSA